MLQDGRYSIIVLAEIPDKEGYSFRVCVQIGQIAEYIEIAYPSEEVEAKEKVFTALSDEVNNELDVKWSEMKSYNEGGSGVVFLLLLLAMVALACFNIWRKLRKKTRNQY